MKIMKLTSKHCRAGREIYLGEKIKSVERRNCSYISESTKRQHNVEIAIYGKDRRESLVVPVVHLG